MSFSVAASLDRYVESLHEEREPDGYWHPSSISGCLRQALYAFRGTDITNPRDPRSKRILRIGHVVHEFVQAALLDDPEIETFYSEVKLTHPGYRITGSTDGLILQKKAGKWVLLEIKSIGQMALRYGKKELPQPEHVVQVTSYMAALREYGGSAVDRLGQMTVLPPMPDLEDAIIVYVPKDDWEVLEFSYKWTQAKEIELLKRLSTLEMHLDEGTLPDRLPDEIKKGVPTRAWLCNYCSYADKCWKEDA